MLGHVLEIVFQRRMTPYKQPSQPPISPSTSALLSPAVKNLSALSTAQERGPISKQRVGPSGYFDHSYTVRSSLDHIVSRSSTLHSNPASQNPLTTPPCLKSPCHCHRWVCSAVWLQEPIVHIALNAFRQTLRRGNR